MDEIFIRRTSSSEFALYRGETELLTGLELADVKGFYELYGEQIAVSGEVRDDAPRPAKQVSTLSAQVHQLVRPGEKTPAARRGRSFILESHVDTIRSMVTENPKTSVRDVETRLRSTGIRFSSRTAITNIARAYQIRLRA